MIAIKERDPVVCDTYTITVNDSDSAMRFGEEMPDSRLTEPSDGKGIIDFHCLSDAYLTDEILLEQNQ